MEQSLPKVLILGHSFNNYDGIGITLSNLFHAWPKDKIAIVSPVIATAFLTQNQICERYFNTSENKSYTIAENIVPQEVKLPSYLKDYRSRIRRKISSFLHKKIGINDLIDRNTISTELIDFINDFRPDIIYTCLGNYGMIKYVNKISRLTGNRYPLAIHIMDDWPATLFNGRYFRGAWQRRYHKAFTDILTRTILNFSISEGMSAEYAARYNREFYPFHNPVSIDFWDSVPDKEYRQDNSVKKIAFFGKINEDTKDALVDMYHVVTNLNKQGRNIRFDIFSPSSVKEIAGLFADSPCCNLCPGIPHEQVCRSIKEYDIVYFPLCFSERTRYYAKLSMSTKTAEYMVSKVPILLYCPPELEIYKYAAGSGWAYCVSERSTELLSKGVTRLITDSGLRDELTGNAYKLAVSRHSLPNVCEAFKTKFIHAVNAYNAG